jgi:hypothetical protein
MHYPEMRKELLKHIDALSNRDYQRDCWIFHRCPPGVEHDELDYAIHFFFDDTKLAEEPVTLIGWILESVKEAEAVKEVTDSIDAMLQKHGYNHTDEYYINTLEWNRVVETAEKAREILSQPA